MYINVAALPNEVVLTVVNRDVEPSREVVSSFDLLHRVTDAVHAHIAEAFLEPMVGRNAEAFYRNGKLAAPTGPANASNLWLRGLGSLLKRRAGDGQAGYEEDSYGVMTGYDRAFGRRLLLGAYGAAVRGQTMTDNRAEARTDSQLLGAYGSVRFGRAYLSAELTAGRGKADTDRREGAGSARAAYDRAHAGASMELGMVLAEWEGGLLKPAAAVHSMRTKFDTQREYGPGAMYIPGFSEDLVQSHVTLQAGQRFTLPWGWRGVADLTIGFRQNLTDPGSTVNASFVAAGDHAAVIPVSTIAEDYWHGGVTGGLGVRFIMGPDSTWGLRATCESSARQQQYTFNGFVNFMW